MHWGEFQTIYDAMSRIHPPAILVKAAGNNYPHSLSSISNQFSKDFDGIIVGSLSPNGFVSEFSQEGEEVHILAPSDNWITSVGSDGYYEQFGGTSGAAPLVTGSLAGFEWLSGYHPTASEAKLLLEQTAIPTIHSAFENPRRNGVGMLNAYKLGMVGKRLKEKCHDNEECFQREIQNPDNYEFSINAENILEQINGAFPECSNQPNETQTISCEDKKSAFKNLRQALLLDIENVNLLEKLHCIHRQEGFLENAFNVELTIASVTKDEDQTVQNLKKLIQRLHENTAEEFENARNKLALMIGDIDGEQLKLLEPLTQNSDEGVRIVAIQAIGEIGDPKGLELLKNSLQDSSGYVRSLVAEAIGKIGDSKGLELLKELIQDSDGWVRSAAIQAIGKIGDPKGLELLEDLLQDSSGWVRSAVAEAIGNIGGERAIRMLRILILDSDEEVRRMAIEYIHKLQQ